MSVTFLTNEDKTLIDQQITELYEEIEAINNLEGVTSEVSVPVTDWTSGSISNGTHAANGKKAYSGLLPNVGQEFSFDASVYKIAWITFNDAGEKVWMGSWITESPFTCSRTEPYIRLEVTPADGSAISDAMLADLSNTVSYKAQGGASQGGTPLVTAISDLRTKNAVGYVDGANGSDANGGSASAPYKTISYAIAKGHTIIKVAPGEYAESLSLSGRSNIAFCVWEYPTYALESWDTPMVHITGGTDKTISYGVQMIECSEIKFDGFWFDNTSAEPVYARDVFGLEMRNCIASNAGTDKNGFRLINTSGRFVDCKAYNAYDGFNIHGYGDTTFENCIAYDCTDDGLSHHDACTGTVIGGEYYGCAKGGISTPTHNAVVNVYGAYCHDNTKYGIYVDTDTAQSSPHTRGIISGCLLKNNGLADIYVRNAAVIAWNNKYDNKTIDATATFTEYAD